MLLVTFNLCVKMPKPLFDNSDDEDNRVTFRSNNDYAKSYNTWRKKEELMRMKTKFGLDDDSDDEPSSCSDDDDEVLKMDEKMDLNFFKTLSSLKNKDPKIYDQNVRFFGDEVIKAPTKMKTKDKPIYIKDYERKMLLENGGIVSDEDEQQENPRAESPTFVQQQENLKRNLKNALNSVDDQEDGEWGGMFQTRTKTKEEEEKDEVDYKKWLQGQSKINDNDAAKDLKPLKDYWSNPELNDGEKFLRDYILNKRFMDNDDDSYIPTYDEVVHDSDKDLSEDDEEIRKQEEFEHKYNFRFEEPDNDFIKRYPRTVDNSVRRTDDRRKTKRAEIKERKLLEKQKKMEEMEHLKKMKRLEIEEKLKALKEITGNDDVPFNDDDLEGDFDPSAHDKRMQMVFNNDYYSVEDEEKPVFSDMDDELEIDQPFEPIDYASGGMNENYDEEAEVNEDAPHCEDADFNMDCDYQQKSAEDEIKENMKKQKWRRKRSHVSKALMKEKPTFDPEDQEYEEYFNEYYKLDCEDFIGDMPCRFKYREVVPNTFGLTIDEILKADDKELNKWCTIKRTVGYRPEQQEKNDHFAFMRRAQNEALKRKVLPSLFKEETEEHTVSKKKRSKAKKVVAEVVEQVPEVEESPKKKKKKSKNATITSESQEIDQVGESTNEDNEKNVADSAESKNEVVEQLEENTTGVSKKKKKKKQIVEENQTEEIEPTEKVNKKRKISETEEIDVPKKKKKSKKTANNESAAVPVSAEAKKVDSKKKKEKEKWKQFSNKIKKPNKKEAEIDISDERLKAYGFNPKKFKNKVKYGHGIF